MQADTAVRRRWRSDASALLFVAAFWTASGLLSAASYVGAQTWAPPGCAGRAGGFMALAFQARALADPIP